MAILFPCILIFTLQSLSVSDPGWNVPLEHLPILAHSTQNITTQSKLYVCQRCTSSYFTFAWELLNVIRMPEFFKILHVKQYPQVTHLPTESSGKQWKRDYMNNNCNLTVYGCSFSTPADDITRSEVSLLYSCESHGELVSPYDPESNSILSCQQSPRYDSTFIYEFGLLSFVRNHNNSLV